VTTFTHTAGVATIISSIFPQLSCEAKLVSMKPRRLYRSASCSGAAARPSGLRTASFALGGKMDGRGPRFRFERLSPLSRRLRRIQLDPSQQPTAHADPLRPRTLPASPCGRKLLQPDQAPPPYRDPLRETRGHLSRLCLLCRRPRLAPPRGLRPP